jgi:hypothetical protein
MTPSIFQPRRGFISLDTIRNPGPKGLWCSMTPAKLRYSSAPGEKWTPCFIGRPHLYRALARRPSGARAASERPAIKPGPASTPRGPLSLSAFDPPINPDRGVSTRNLAIPALKTCRNHHMQTVATAPLLGLPRAQSNRGLGNILINISLKMAPRGAVVAC